MSSVDEQLQRATLVALQHAWHGERTAAFTYEWARLCRALLGEANPAKCPSVRELEELSIALTRLSTKYQGVAFADDVTKFNKKRWTFAIDEPTPSLNVLRRQYANARHYAVLRNRFEQYVMVARMNEKIPKATKLRRVRITRYATREDRLLDLDNFIGGAKPLLDALVRQGLIVDDNDKFLNCSYEQRTREPGRTDKHTVITIEED